jgi:hypothetical protein
MAPRAIRGWRVIRYVITSGIRERVEETFVLAATRREAKSIANRERHWYGAILTACREPTVEVAARRLGLPLDTEPEALARLYEGHGEVAVAEAIRAEQRP